MFKQNAPPKNINKKMEELMFGRRGRNHTMGKRVKPSARDNRKPNLLRSALTPTQR